MIVVHANGTHRRQKEISKLLVVGATMTTDLLQSASSSYDQIHIIHF